MDTRDKEQFEEWVKSNLKKLHVSPSQEYMDKSLAQLTGILGEERQRLKRRRRWVRMAEGVGAVAAVVLIALAIPQFIDQQQEPTIDTNTATTMEGAPLGDPPPEVGILNGEQLDAKMESAENNAFRVSYPSPWIVGADFSFSGLARVFEGQFHWEVEDGHNILAQGIAMTDRGAPEWGRFHLEIGLEQPPTSPHGMLILYERSPKDGSRINELFIPLEFEKELVIPISGMGEVDGPFEEVTVQLRDDRQRDASFEAYFTRLTQAVEQRDVAALQSLMAPNIMLGFDPELDGVDKLAEHWYPDGNAQDSEMWVWLEQVLRLGAIYMEETKEFAAPGILWDKEAFMDSYRYGAIIGENVNVRAEPSMQGKVIDTITNLRVMWGSRSAPEGWVPVRLPSGEEGFVARQYAYSPIGYRAGFVKMDGEWKMSYFLGGD